ncbi:MAG: hypothetical protein M1490_03150 [Candidatus Bathyarchaeota archaeon]|nr:hypothetical protein [Candidatus Bathyarchaeota archaeon]
MSVHQKFIREIAQKLHNRQYMYGSVLVSCYLRREGSSWENITTMITPLCKGDPAPSTEKLNYGNFALFRTIITIEELIQIVTNLPEF